MPARTVRGSCFEICTDDLSIVVKVIAGKGRRFRVIAPKGVRIVSGFPGNLKVAESFEPKSGSSE